MTINEKMKAADALADAASRLLHEHDEEVYALGIAYLDLEEAEKAYDAAGPWPAPLEVGDEEAAYMDVRHPETGVRVRLYKHRDGSWVDKLEVGDESADPDLGPRNDMIAGLTTALRAAVERLPDHSNPARPYLYEALDTILYYHPEPDVAAWLRGELERMA